MNQFSTQRKRLLLSWCWVFCCTKSSLSSSAFLLGAPGFRLAASNCNNRIPQSLAAGSQDENEDSSLGMDRMEMVRKLQKSFYKTDDYPRAELDEKTGIMKNLPLWRVGWTEVPGRANCLNVHEGQYTHMFETILNGPKPWYVGHLHQPGGFKSTRTGEKRFQLKTWRDEINDTEQFLEPERAAVVGALMRITDYRRMKDGRLVLLVHVLERFVVENIIQEQPYSIADVQILCDVDNIPEGADENFARISRAANVNYSFQFHDYEFDHVQLPVPTKSNDDGPEYTAQEEISGVDIAKLLPFAFYSKDERKLQNVEKMPDDIPSSSFSGGQPPLEKILKTEDILQSPPVLEGGGGPTNMNRRSESPDALETLLWLAIEEFCRLNNFNPPPELTCLIPSEMDYLDIAAHSHQDQLSDKYPAMRRQHRLSYTAPALLERLIDIEVDKRKALLCTPSTVERLAFVLEQFEFVNAKAMGEFE
jgi:Lon protease-like protein